MATVNERRCVRSMTPSRSATPMARPPWSRARWRSRLCALPVMALINSGCGSNFPAVKRSTCGYARAQLLEQLDVEADEVLNGNLNSQEHAR